MLDKSDKFNYRTLPVFASYIDRIGAEQLNFRKFIVREYKGQYYHQKSFIKIEPDGSIDCTTIDHAPTPEEAKAIKAELTQVIAAWPVSRGATKKLFQNLEGLTTGTLFAFWDQPRKEILFVQERRDRDDGGKDYIPWAFFSDGDWLQMELDGKLPFWKPEKTRNKAQIMIHEGAKAAAFVDGLINDPKRKKERAEHPWAKELADYEHWGMIGGALAPHRTDYDELIKENPTEVVYVCDADKAGEAALQKVSKRYGRPMKGIRFGQDFKHSWDLADPMPPKLFVNKRWVGPSLGSLMVPATFATEMWVPSAKGGRPTPILKHHITDEWVHSVVPDVYIHRDWPSRIYSPSAFDDHMRPFSDTATTSDLLKKENAIKVSILAYNPSKKSGIFGGDEKGLFFNTHCVSRIRPEPGDAGPWLEFMDHLIPLEKDRYQTMRWCATLIACPEIKMMYALLLISETQGVGKSTLGERILGPIIGEENTSYPTESEIVDSDYTYWLANRRLAVVNEIYAGHSSKAYNKLKDIITGRMVSIKQKYMANYTIENWIHILACSNNFNALKLTGDDRRWFIPRVTEKKKEPEYWKRFNAWLNNDGGLQIIAYWAHEFLKTNPAITHGDAAPWSDAKQDVVEEGYSPGMQMVDGIMKTIKGLSGKDGEYEHCIILDNDFVGLIKDQIYEGRATDHLEKPSTIRKVAKGCGWFTSEYKTQLRDGTTGRLICTDKEDALTLPSELFRRVNPTRIRLLCKRKLIVEADGAVNIKRVWLDDVSAALLEAMKKKPGGGLSKEPADLPSKEPPGKNAA